MKTFALAGNPNCGKTTLFNALTGATAHVGNWPGVTVDKREGTYKGEGGSVHIIDLPGIYSLSPYTPEEVIASDYISNGKPDGIINIVDATNLERNLYLTTQLLEVDVPVIIALNMTDEVEKAGDKIDVKALEEALGVPVVQISALKKTGIKQLMARAAALPAERKGSTFFEIPSEGDMEGAIANARYNYITEKLSPAKVKKAPKGELTKSDKIDGVLTHRVWAIPIFIAVLFLVFHLTFSENLFFLNGFTEEMGWMPSLVELGLAAEADGEVVYNNFGVEILSVFYDGTVYSPGVILTNFLNLFLDHISDGIITLMENGGAAEWAVGLVGDGIS